MPRGQNLKTARPPKEARLRRLGIQEALQPDEISLTLRVRLRKALVPRVTAITAKQRGEALMIGLRALGLLEVKDATTDEQTP